MRRVPLTGVRRRPIEGFLGKGGAGMTRTRTWTLSCTIDAPTRRKGDGDVAKYMANKR